MALLTVNPLPPVPFPCRSFCTPTCPCSVLSRARSLPCESTIENLVLAKAKVLHPHTAGRLAETYKFAGGIARGAEAVDGLPRTLPVVDPATGQSHFLGEVPLVLRAGLSGVGPKRGGETSRSSPGLERGCSRTIDSEGRGEITFEAFLAAVSLFHAAGCGRGALSIRISFLRHRR